MHNPIMFTFVRPASSGAKANGVVKEEVVPNHFHNLPKTGEIKDRQAETSSLHLEVVSGVHVHKWGSTTAETGGTRKWELSISQHM